MGINGKLKIQYIGSRAYCKNTDFLFYTIDIIGYEMGLEVLDDQTESVLVTLFHWPDDYDGKQRLSYYPTESEGHSYLKVYGSKRGRYFNYKGTRVYLPA